MTTEIAVMNKSAVALAADSAVTITSQTAAGRSHKVLNTANKLFSLSKCSPVGLMIYGNAGMLGIPWETIVKMYREQLRDKSFATTRNYADDFFKFLDKFDVGDDLQRMFVLQVSKIELQSIRSALDEWVDDKIKHSKPNSVSESDVGKQLIKTIKDRYSESIKHAKDSRISANKREGLRKKFRSRIKSLCEEIFEELPLNRELHSKLLTIAINASCVSRGRQSGIVIAGFGDKDLYPKCYDYDVTGVLAGTTIRKDIRSQEISHNNDAVIMPFAQSDDVKTFMEGIGPSINDFLHNSFTVMFSQALPNVVRDEVSSKLSLNDTQKKELYKILKDVCKGACQSAFEELHKQKSINYIDPVLNATSFLNKEELASMAETLVNLVSFRKQVSFEAETVGGPIDVAVISKGDGFIWIKRKNYFPADLNHHYFSNYYRGVNGNGKKRS